MVTVRDCRSFVYQLVSTKSPSLFQQQLAYVSIFFHVDGYKSACQNCVASTAFDVMRPSPEVALPFLGIGVKSWLCWLKRGNKKNTPFPVLQSLQFMQVFCFTVIWFGVRILDWEAMRSHEKPLRPLPLAESLDRAAVQNKNDRNLAIRIGVKCSLTWELDSQGVLSKFKKHRKHCKTYILLHNCKYCKSSTIFLPIVVLYSAAPYVPQKCLATFVPSSCMLETLSHCHRAGQPSQNGHLLKRTDLHHCEVLQNIVVAQVCWLKEVLF